MQQSRNRRGIDRTRCRPCKHLLVVWMSRSPRGEAAHLSVGGLRFDVQDSPWGVLASGLERYAARAGPAPRDAPADLSPRSSAGPGPSHQPGEQPWHGDGRSPLDGARLLAGSAFRFNLGPGDSRGASVWDRGDYTRFATAGHGLADADEPPPVRGLPANGEAMSVTVGVDAAWSLGVVDVALSHTEVKAGYGPADAPDVAIEATVSGL